MSHQLAKKQVKNPTTIIGKEDINFSEFTLGVLRKNSNANVSEIIFQDPIKPNQKISISSGIHGFPTQFTRDLYRALMRLTHIKNRFGSGKVKCTLRDICRELGVSVGGKTVSQIKESLDILTGIRIKFYYSYYDLKEKATINEIKSIGILDGYTLREFNKKGSKKNSQKVENFITWSSSFWNLSLKEAKNLINYDYSFYVSLRGNIAKELYIFLNKRAFTKKFFKIPIRVLAFEKLGMSRTLTNNLSKVRQQLRKAHQELLGKGFLATEPEFVKNQDKTEEWIHYSFAVRHKYPAGEKGANFFEQTLLVFSEEQEKLKSDLKDLDFTEGQIGKMFGEYETKFLQNGLELLAITDNVKNQRNWYWGYLKGKYDVETLEAQKQKEQERQEWLIQEAEAKQKQLEQKAKQDQKNAKQQAQIDDWIVKNPLQWIQMCQTYIDKDFQNNNPFFYQQLNIQSTNQQKTPLEIFTASRMYNNPVRWMVWDIVRED